MMYQVVETSTAFAGKLIRVRIDRIVTPEGRERIVEVVEHQGAVAIVPIDADGQVWMVRQYRHPAGKVLLEIPAGTLEPGEDPSACAARECREEIGMAPGELISLRAGYLAPGYSTEYLHYFIARQLTPAPLPLDDDEQIDISRIPLATLWNDVNHGRIADIKTIAGIALAREFLQLENS